MVICTRWKALLSDVKGLKDAADNFCQLDWTFFSVPHSVNKKLPVTNAAGNAAALPPLSRLEVWLYTLWLRESFTLELSVKKMQQSKVGWWCAEGQWLKRNQWSNPTLWVNFGYFAKLRRGKKAHLEFMLFSTGIVLAASGKKRSSSICLSLPARKHGFYNRKGTTSSLSYHSKASPSLLRLCQMRLLPPTNRLRLLPLCG